MTDATVANETKETRVVFRVWRRFGACIALFPDLPWNLDGMVTSYEHHGQHGGADYAGCVRRSVPATAEQSAALRKELEGIGYKLREVRHR